MRKRLLIALAAIVVVAIPGIAFAERVQRPDHDPRQRRPGSDLRRGPLVRLRLREASRCAPLRSRPQHPQRQQHRRQGGRLPPLRGEGDKPLRRIPLRVKRDPQERLPPARRVLRARPSQGLPRCGLPARRLTPRRIENTDSVAGTRRSEDEATGIPGGPWGRNHVLCDGDGGQAARRRIDQGRSVLLLHTGDLRLGQVAAAKCERNRTIILFYNPSDDTKRRGFSFSAVASTTTDIKGEYLFDEDNTDKGPISTFPAGDYFARVTREQSAETTSATGTTRG